MTTNVSSAIPVPPAGPTAGATGTYSLWQAVLPAAEAARSALDSALTDTSAGHDHDGTDSKTVSHANVAGVTSGQHHAQAHAIGGADHTGVATFAQMPALQFVTSGDVSFTSTALANVTGAAFSLAASATYLFTLDVLVDGPTADDIALALTSSGAVNALKWSGTGGTVATPATLYTAYVTASATSASFGTLAAGTPNSVQITGRVRTSGAVTLTLQAKQVAHVGTSKVLQDSWGLAWRVA